MKKLKIIANSCFDIQFALLTNHEQSFISSDSFMKNRKEYIVEKAFDVFMSKGYDTASNVPDFFTRHIKIAVSVQDEVYPRDLFTSAYQEMG